MTVYTENRTDPLATQAPQVLALVYVGTSGAILPAILLARRSVRGGLRLSRLAILGALALLTLICLTVLALLVILVAFVLPGLVHKVVFVSTALVLVAITVVFAWPLRRRTLRWLRDSPATSTIDDSRLQTIADRHALYDFGQSGITLVFVVVATGAFAAMLPRPGRVSDALAVELFLTVLGSSAVALCVLEALRRIFPDAVLVDAYHRGPRTTRLVDLCDRCFSREIRRAPEALRNAYQRSAEKTLATMAKDLHHTERDTTAVRTAIHDALKPSLSLGGHEVVHRLGSGTPSLRTELTRIASVLAIAAGVVGSLKVLAGVIGPILR